MSGRIVLFGATGYTGELTARALVDRGARPVLAARSRARLEALAADLGGLETGVADVAHPESVRALLGRGDVLISTVGPFARWGAVAAEAAISAGAHYLDITGEPAFIRRVFADYSPRAQAAGSLMLTAFGFDWVPGNLAGALALDQAGYEAARVLIAYVPKGTRVSGGTAASMAGALLEPSFAYRGGRLRGERTGARVREFELGDGRRRGISVGGSEHITLPVLHPQLREVEVLLGRAGATTRVVPLLTGVLSLATAVPPIQAAARSLARRTAPGSSGGPSDAERARGSCIVLAEARSASGRLLSRVRLDGPDGYSFTADILAWGAMTIATGRIAATGAVGPVQAFSVEGLASGAEQAGLTLAPSSQGRISHDGGGPTA